MSSGCLTLTHFGVEVYGLTNVRLSPAVRHLQVAGALAVVVVLYLYNAALGYLVLVPVPFSVVLDYSGGSASKLFPRIRRDRPATARFT